jgi:monofunctional biosynthetic peptidoglycan transglycosylase
MSRRRRTLCPPAFAIVALAFVVSTTRGQHDHREQSLFEFDAPDSADAWMPLHDTVMGGVSSGAARTTEEGTLLFSGVVSLENNGGFASTRVDMTAMDLSAYDALRFRVRGDGKKYALSVQTDFRIMAGAYYFDFETEAEEWHEVRVPLHALRARSFGRPLRDAPPVDARSIRSLGFMISDKQAGPYRLEIDWIRAVRTDEAPSPRLEAAGQRKAQQAALLIQRAIALGVPLFNSGRPAACAAVYEIAARAVVDLAGAELPGDVAGILRAGLAKAEQAERPSARAWAIRHALDASLRILTRDEDTEQRPDE